MSSNVWNIVFVEQFFFVNMGSLSLKELHFLNHNMLLIVSWTLYQSHILNLDLLPILSWTLYESHILNQNLVPFVSLNQYNPVTMNNSTKELNDLIELYTYFTLFCRYEK